jgi:simple sugar transport system substrate-binding protein
MKFPERIKLGVAAALFATLATTATAADIAVIGGRVDDPFFAIVKRGVDDAASLAKTHDASVNYLPLKTYENIGADAATLIRTAIAQGAKGIAAPNWVPEAQDPAYKAAVDAGIPIILYNAGGADKASELGAINYVGTEDYTAGVAAGTYLGAAKAKKVICVNTVPGAANLEARCKGVADGATPEGSSVKQLPLPASNFGDKTAVTEALKAAMLSDPEIDALVTMGNQDADSAAVAIQQAGAQGRVKLGTFNTDQASLDRIAAGTQSFAVDQQGYLQGYLAVFLLDSYVTYGMKSPTMQILTGPLIVDSANVRETLVGVKAGVR